MTDRVCITGVQAQGVHGVLPEERTYSQPFIVDISAEVETREAARTDSVGYTVSYADLAADAVEVVTGESANLIETLADRIAAKALARGALSATVTVHKPEAPVGTAFQDASVQITRYSPVTDAEAGIRHAVLSLGANLGNTREALGRAVKAIGELDVHVDAVSDYFSTAPLLAPGQEPQPDYLNAVLTLDTALAPYELLAQLQRIEVRGGRVRHERWGARLIDIDIVDFDGIAWANERLMLPHPRAAERLFVLEPWLSIEPEATLGGHRVADIVGSHRAELHEG